MTAMNNHEAEVHSKKTVKAISFEYSYMFLLLLTI